MAADEIPSTGKPTPQQASLGRVTGNAKPQSARSSFSPGLGPVPGVPPPSVEVVASERRKGQLVRPEDWGCDGKDSVGVSSQSVYRPHEEVTCEEVFLFTYLCVNYQREWWSWRIYAEHLTMRETKASTELQLPLQNLLDTSPNDPDTFP